MVADYGDILAYSEVDAALATRFPGVQVIPTNVPSFQTVIASFVDSQIARQPLDPERHCILINVDGRTHTDKPLPNGEGAPLVCATLDSDSGLLVVSPNAGFSLSLLKPRIRECYVFNNGNGGSQFRSRDVFPGCLFMAKALRSANRSQLPALPLAKIPDLDPAQPLVLWVDGFGNVKTSITRVQARQLGWVGNQELPLTSWSEARAQTIPCP